MNTNRKGITPIPIILLIAAGIAVLVGVFYYFHKPPPSSPPPVVNNPPIVVTSTVPTLPIAPSTSTPQSAGTLSPSSGPIGTVVTIHGNGFSSTGNTITLNGLVGASLTDVSSPNGKALMFTVPQSLGPDCKTDQPCPEFLMEVGDGNFTVSVISNGVTQNIGIFTVTGAGGLRVAPQS
ncbi:MAG TPA: IPT/TIG domain-containing protein [Candidatus Paceibacterota bacterium]|nr:IPT/TIG domain-containing protein [Candidatus Paceibacterota bacterium]